MRSIEPSNYLIKMALDLFRLGYSHISMKEFDQILKSLGQNLREDELETIVQKIDRDGNGFIDFD